MLTKKDYWALVEVINKATKGNYVSGPRAVDRGLLVNYLCQWLHSDNPNFDESKFRAAILD